MTAIRNKLWLLVLVLVFLLGTAIDSAQAGPLIKGKRGTWLKINYSIQLMGVWRDQGSGPDGLDSTTDIFFKRDRITFFGKAARKLMFNLQIEHKGARRITDLGINDDATNTLNVLDAFMIWNYSKHFKTRIGLTKDPLTRENNEGCFSTLSSDRSNFIFTPHAASRDMGIVAWGNFYKNHFQYRIGIMEGRESSDSPKSAFRYTGRVHLTLLDKADTSLIYEGTYLGRKKVLTFGAGYQVEPDVVYGNLSAKTNAKDNNTWTVDAFFEYPTPSGTFTLAGAYLDVNFDDAHESVHPDPKAFGQYGQRNGYYVKAGYLLPRKVGIGKVQFFGRYENWNYAQLLDVDDQELDWYAAGINYYIRGQKTRITVEYTKTDFEKEDPTIPCVDFNTVNVMLQFLF